MHCLLTFISSDEMTLSTGMSPLEDHSGCVPLAVILVFPRQGVCYSQLCTNQCKVYTTLRATTCYQLVRALGTCDPLHSEPVIPRIQYAACYIRWLDTVIQEGIGQKLCIECSVIRWTKKDEVSNASDFVSVRGGLGPK
jgi:hypothetical protein